MTGILSRILALKLIIEGGLAWQNETLPQSAILTRLFVAGKVLAETKQ